MSRFRKCPQRSFSEESQRLFRNVPCQCFLFPPKEGERGETFPKTFREGGGSFPHHISQESLNLNMLERHCLNTIVDDCIS